MWHHVFPSYKYKDIGVEKKAWCHKGPPQRLIFNLSPVNSNHPILQQNFQHFSRKLPSQNVGEGTKNQLTRKVIIKSAGRKKTWGSQQLSHGGLIEPWVLFQLPLGLAGKTQENTQTPQHTFMSKTLR